MQRALKSGPVLFLKAEQLEGNSWISFATTQGLSGVPVEHFLVEVGAVGTPLLFIDAIDRVQKAHQPIVLDLIRAILESPLLINWRIVFSLRDSEIGCLKIWLGHILTKGISVETLRVDQLNDDEAKELAKAKPHLRPLLFGSPQVQRIVRRPFFAKVLNQSHLADPEVPTISPQSELDLIENWWLRGGYDETGQNAIERQCQLLELASTCSQNLSKPIHLSQLSSVARIDELRADGILQSVRNGISVRFAHDIFFEWTFFYVLADRGSDWISEIKNAGEPPVVGRVVELVSQWEYVNGSDWETHLAGVQDANLRSQWLRAWLFGPLGNAKFEAKETLFQKVVFADNFRILEKLLVWFQAEKTSPNPHIQIFDLALENHPWFAEYLGWPSDFWAWRRLIDFLLRHISDISSKLYPNILTIFEVWENALSGTPNSTSRAFLRQCADWLSDLESRNSHDVLEQSSGIFAEVPDTCIFQKSLVQLLLRSSLAEPTSAADYLRRVISSNRIDDDTFRTIITFSPILAQTLPKLVVELSLAYLRQELPDERQARKDQRHRANLAWREAVLAKPESERTPQERMILENGMPLGVDVSSFWDNKGHSIRESFKCFVPQSALREPFFSLFQSSPDQALRLLTELCNHAIDAWRQQHRYSRDSFGTPIPLELTFPWGVQTFWGTDREYLWFRSTCAPQALGCGFMALEEWCFAELKQGKPVDELIQKILDGNKCVAILGVASMLALHTERVSEVTFPLVTSQRLLGADQNRRIQEMSISPSNLIGFEPPADMAHFKAIQTANSRKVRQIDLSWLVSLFIFSNQPIGDRTRKALLDFKNFLPYQYEEHRTNQEKKSHLTAQANRFSELADPQNYQVSHPEGCSGPVSLIHVSPSAAEPEIVAKIDAVSKELIQIKLCLWAMDSFKEKILGDTFKMPDAIALAREIDVHNLFEEKANEIDEEFLGVCRGAVASIGAMVLHFRVGRSQGELEWARDVIMRAIRLPEKIGPRWMPNSPTSWHHAIYVARGISAEIQEETALSDAGRHLLGLIAHPLEIVSTVALEETCRLWEKDPKLTWSALFLALSLCHIQKRPYDQVRGHNEPLHSPNEVQVLFHTALDFYVNGSEWPSLPLPPPAWVKVDSRKKNEQQDNNGHPSAIDSMNITGEWRDSDTRWHRTHAARILRHIPFESILKSKAKNSILDFLSGILDWTIRKKSPPWMEPGLQNVLSPRSFEWENTLSANLGYVAGFLPFDDLSARFLEPILKLRDDDCWDLLSQFLSNYVCCFLYDSPVVPPDLVLTLQHCLERILQAPYFKHDAHQGGQFFGSHLRDLTYTLMFVSVPHSDHAVRYVNGDWSEIDRILPIIDRLVRAGGFALPVMDSFLTLCERARERYPANIFADQVLSIIDKNPVNSVEHDTVVLARIAELVQHFVHRDAPMELNLAQKYLSILDILVDMGDRRSAALQLSEAFREVRRPS
ncbi:hypothetical protein [Sulfidibacter corallicola]|uniref:ATP-binding protein n=1 Tax=Sulfidibacter corallicola TaxID=2818388 RepID=A0A8A4TNN6_SULCO|nr:hypothetical protein [Sulfidibacter corallicola]QTD50712.1 hypothetical protein J3U87_34430 [Sulfidibacter corallicola]